MKRAYEFYCDNDDGKPTEEELVTAIELANDKDCYVKLNYLPNKYSSWYTIVIRSGMTLNDCKSRIPSTFPIQLDWSNNNDESL